MYVVFGVLHIVTFAYSNESLNTTNSAVISTTDENVENKS